MLATLERTAHLEDFLFGKRVGRRLSSCLVI